MYTSGRGQKRRVGRSSPQLRRHRVPEAWNFNAETAVRGLCKLRKKESFVAARQNICAAPVPAAERADSKSRSDKNDSSVVRSAHSVVFCISWRSTLKLHTHNHDMAASLCTAQYHSERFDPTKDFITRQMVTLNETMDPLTGLSWSRCAA